jgi:hypothetical protein
MARGEEQILRAPVEAVVEDLVELLLRHVGVGLALGLGLDERDAARGRADTGEVLGLELGRREVSELGDAERKRELLLVRRGDLVDVGL